MLPIAALAIVFAELCYQTVASRAANDEELDPLRFSSDGTFQITVFSDLHFGQGSSGTGPEKDRSSVRVMSDILDCDPPDLVVLNGDLINGDTTRLENSSHYVDQIVAPMVERNLTWASAYGNHDRSRTLDGDSILEREYMWPGARTDKMVSGVDAGVTNYYLPVYTSNCTTTQNCTPELLLWFFDSRGGSYYQGDTQPNWVDSSVARWFNETNDALVEEYNKTIPSLAFVHIPIHATYEIQQQEGINRNYHPGINEESVVQQGQGWCADGEQSESCDYGDQDLPFMRSLVATSGIIGLFYGHDHGNSWCYKWDSKLSGMDVAGNGINLCYGQHTGYNGYGDWIRGGRQILVTLEGLEDSMVDTYIRLETGQAVGSISLNSTFNTDFYSSTMNQKTYFNAARTSPAASNSPFHDRNLAFYILILGINLATSVWLNS